MITVEDLLKLCEKLKGIGKNNEKCQLTEKEKKLIEVVTETKEETKPKENPKITVKEASLDAEVDKYIKWAYKNRIKGYYTKEGEYRKPVDLRNLIEKMAVWYELRFPDYEINKLMPCSAQEGIDVDDVMFNKNRYINENFEENADVRALDWDKFYNTHAFIQSLPKEDRSILKKPKFGGLVYLNGNLNPYKHRVRGQFAHIHLNQEGFITEAEQVDIYSNNKVTNEELIGMHIIDLELYLREKGVNLPRNSEVYSMLKEYEKKAKETEGFLDSVMYRIIERGGSRMGPRRAFLFAKEFERDIHIPMMYAVDKSDPGLRRFMNEFIKAGGRKELICYEGYFQRTKKTRKLDTVCVEDLILTQPNNAFEFYTPEETELHQRIVDAVSSKINPEELKKEQVKQLRLERRLQKARQRMQNDN